MKSGNCVIELADDGRGIDWEAIRSKARSMSLPNETEAELYEALFANGVTTRDEITSISGRGAGMGAVRDACRAMGGPVSLESTRGKGTVVRLSIPLRYVAMRGTSLKPAVRVSLRPSSLPPRGKRDAPAPS
jgi:two-component system, chemotaxis family, sensor kinase CheA